MSKGNAITASDLYAVLTPKEKKQFAELLTSQKPCDRSGHKYKLIGTKPRWFKKPATIFVCTQCGGRIET